MTPCSVDLLQLAEKHVVNGRWQEAFQALAEYARLPEISGTTQLLAQAVERLASAAGKPGCVDRYWNDFTVQAPDFQTAGDSLEYLEWRFKQYPYFREFMELYGDHTGETVVDYGCGPGNDVIGFLAHSCAAKVIGIDVSDKAFDLARKRMALHGFPPERYELLQVSDAVAAIPLPDRSVDYIYCEGVLHHTSDPAGIMAEFRRILKPDGACCIMVYNRNSIWYHLYTAYQRMILENAFPGMTVDEAFRQNIDGDRCPIARAYLPEQFCELCREVGFAVEYVGGYLSNLEMDVLVNIYAKAIRDPRLALEHKHFLRELNYDMFGFPVYRNKHAGIGGVYKLRHASSPLI